MNALFYCDARATGSPKAPVLTIMQVDGRGTGGHDPLMTAIQSHIRSLECYVEQGGGCVVREPLPDTIHGWLSRDRITLHAGLEPHEQLCALLHEITHWLVHRDVLEVPSARATIYEYEAEAVESLVMGRLGLPCPADDAPATKWYRSTDGLLTSSVTRVLSTTRRICQALALETQAPIDVEAATGEEVVLEDKAHGMRNFLG